MIRRAEMSDKNEIFNILSETQSPWSLTGVSEAIENDCNIVLVDEEEKIRAVLILQLVSDECEILNFAVKREYRKKGIGKEILNNGTDLCKSRGADFFYLEVRRSNNVAISLYKQCGFEIVGERKNYYQSPLEDAIVMRNQCIEKCKGDFHE